MNTDQLKMILDTLQTMGVAGHDAFIWWLVMDKGLPVLGWLLTFSGLVWLAKHGIRCIGANSLGEQVRDTLGVGSDGPVTRGEAIETLRRVKEMVEKRGG